MTNDYLHNHESFPDLLLILADKMGIQSGLIEKDYWIMHVLYGLKKQGFGFELKGGTSLSKGYRIIDRFSEDIDIHIKPPESFGINENPKNNKPKNIEARKRFYDWLAETISIEGIVSVERDHAFDDESAYRSGGIRLYYRSLTSTVEGLKEGILLEAGFDTVTPNTRLAISSWSFEEAVNTVPIIDNRALDISCYHPGYTLVEKLQTIATKFRQEQADGQQRPNYMRQYYDVYCLLGMEEVLRFIGTPEYEAHKIVRFPQADLAIPLCKNEAYMLGLPGLRERFNERYKKSAALYFKGQPDLNLILERIAQHLDRL